MGMDKHAIIEEVYHAGGCEAFLFFLEKIRIMIIKGMC